MSNPTATDTPSEEAIVHANGLDICYEVFGAPSATPVLLIMGNSAPGLVWPNRFCSSLASKGFRVVRFDQRDSGLSSHIDYEVHPYTLDDLAKDAFALLDALGIDGAHLVGLSQGGVVAYRMGIMRADRVKSLAVIMSTADLTPKNAAFAGAPAKADELPRPAADYVARVVALNRHAAEGVDARARRFVDNFRLAKGPTSPFEEGFWAELGRAFAERPMRRKDGRIAAIANNSNNARAQMATAPLSEEDLQGLRPPVLIVHGDADPIFPIEHARWAARVIPGSDLVEIPTMGHALDPAFFSTIASALVRFWTTGC